MAFKIEEGWLSSKGTVLAVKKKNGGYLYFVHAYSTVNGESLIDQPSVAREISTLNLEIMEAKR